ncbi:MAG TPA: response regulator [Syntrophorhabdales bacterium]|nr:response regulator [Syntrophorhabdales bacterium]
MEKKHILFVDDEPMILEAMQRMLRDKRNEWDMSFATTGQEALELLGKGRVDVLVSDMRMPGMNGAELLNEVKNRFPGVIRIILSGQADQDAVMKLVLPAHQYLSKPCDPQTIKLSIERELQLNDLLTNDCIRRVISGMDTLPSSPALYVKVMEELSAPDPSINAIAEIVSKDVGMTAKLLQLVNSAFFALPQRVSNLMQAVSLLGLDTIKTLVLSIHIFSQFDQGKLSALNIAEVWHHSLMIGLFAKTISRLENQSQVQVDDALMAGLLHDAGKLVLAANFPKEYIDITSLMEKEGLTASEAEGRVLSGPTHAEIGAYLMGLWGLPRSIVEAIALHHRPQAEIMQGFDVRVAVYAANLLEHNMEASCPEWVRAASRLAVWKTACMSIGDSGGQDG